jgi:pimeloyl-ACP methyl ester carboxylesterase
VTTESVLGLDMEINVTGDGPAALLFVHGFCGDTRDWSKQVGFLSSFYRIIECDLPGHGKSAMPQSSGVSRMASAVIELKNSHGLSRNILIGHSLGCRIVLEAHDQDAANISGIVLIDGSRLGEAGASTVKEGSRKSLPPGNGPRKTLRELFADMLLPESAPELKSLLLQRVELMPQHYAEEIQKSVVAWDATRVVQVLQRVSVPLLVLQSTYVDPSFERRSIKDRRDSPWIDFVTRHVPHAEVEIVTGAGHYPHLERPEAVNATIRRFAQQVLAG